MTKWQLTSASHLLGWFPEVLRLGSQRIRGQVRLLGFAALVGIVAGLGGIAFYVATRVVEHYALGVWAGYYPQPHPGGEPSFAWLSVVSHPFHPWLLLLIPTLGGIVSGLLVFTIAPEAEGHGTDAVIAAYHYRQGQIRPRVPLVKIVASAVTLGTGGSGGREGPIAQIGAGFGSLLANLLRLWAVDRRVLMAAGMGAGIAASFVIVGMAGVFAAAAKTPFSTLIIVSEMTGGYSLLLPALWVCTLSFILSDEQSIYSSQVESRSRSPAHQGSYVREVLTGVRVSEFLSSQPGTAVLHPGDSLDTLIEQLSDTPYATLPVVDGQNRLLGVVCLEEIHLALHEPALKPLALAEDLMRTGIRPLTPDDTLDRALELFVENDLLALPVVDDLKRRQVIGMARRYEIASAYVRRVHGPAPTD